MRRSIANNPMRSPIDPNPDNFKLIRSYQQGERHFAVMVNYPNCINYEGNKIIVYRNVSFGKFLSQKSLDPHFFRGKIGDVTPFARFEPTDAGWNAAIKLVNELESIDSWESTR